MEGAVVGELIAQVKREASVVFRCREAVLKTFVLKPNGALSKPEVLRHPLDEQDFGGGGRSVLGVESVGEFVEFLLAFPGGNHERASQTVAEVVH